MDSDIVVVGSGAAGLTAALAAATRGARVVVLEKARVFGGTTAMSGGVIWTPNNRWMAEAGIDDSKEQTLLYLKHVTIGRAPWALIETFVDECNETVELLEREGGVGFEHHPLPDYQPELPGGNTKGRGLLGRPFELARLGDLQDRLREVPALRRLDLDATAGRGPVDRYAEHGRALVAHLLAACAERGVGLVSEAAVLELLRENGRVVGVLMDHGGRQERVDARRGVVLASGGFEFDPVLVERFLPIPLRAPLGAPSNVGDGLRMAMKVGAALGNMSEAWWSPAFQITGETYDGQPMYRGSGEPRNKPGLIMVNRRGRRFANEGLNYHDVTRALMVFDPTTYAWENLPAWLIFDARYRQTYAITPQLAPGTEDPAWLSKAGSLRDLAASVGIDPEGLEDEVATYNVHATTGRDPAFHRGESAYDRHRGDPSVGPNPNLRPFGTGPYYAIEICIGTLGTKGGPVIDRRGRVVDHAGRAIPGLCASGNVVANVFGPSYPGPGATLGSGTTFARLGVEALLS